MSLHPHPGSGQHLSSVSSSRFPSFSPPIQFASIHGAVHGMSNIPLEHGLAVPIPKRPRTAYAARRDEVFSRVVLCRAPSKFVTCLSTNYRLAVSRADALRCVLCKAAVSTRMTRQVHFQLISTRLKDTRNLVVDPTLIGEFETH